MTMTKSHGYTYQAPRRLATSELAHEDIIGGDKRLDFETVHARSLARVDSFAFLSADEKRMLNQIRGNTICASLGWWRIHRALRHGPRAPMLSQDDYRTRALLNMAGEEAKHIQLFKRFREDFDRGFGETCAVIGPPDAIAAAVLSHDPLAVAITILHIEWMSQRHYVESIADNRALDLQFKSLLKHHGGRSQHLGSTR